MELEGGAKVYDLGAFRLGQGLVTYVAPRQTALAEATPLIVDTDRGKGIPSDLPKGRPEDTRPCAPHLDLFFPPTSHIETAKARGDRVVRARSICAVCDIGASCLAGALARSEPEGVWGGAEVAYGEVVTDPNS